MIELPEGIELVDPRPVAAEAPYTYFLPFAAEISAVAVGDSVKAVFRQTTGETDYDAERMWVDILAIEGDDFIGILANQPFDMPLLKLGDRVRLPRTHVIDTQFADESRRPATPERREYWDRCFVDDCVLEGRSHADYLYREEPDMGQEGDKYPDSGWRIRGSDEAIEDDEANSREPRYVALGKVLNADDRWLSLIDSPVGSHFRWWPEDSAYIELE